MQLGVVSKNHMASVDSGDRQELLGIIKELSFSTDKVVTLSSGRQSNLYFNMKPTMLNNRASLLIAKELLRRLPGGKIYVGGLEMGAVPIVSALCPVASLDEREVQCFFVRKRPKEHGSKKLVEGLPERDSLDGKVVYVVDDVTTTGGSVLATIAILSELGAKVSKVISIVDRLEGASETFKAERISFESIFNANDFLNSNL